MTLGELESLREAINKVKALLSGIGLSPTIANDQSALASLQLVFDEISAFELEHLCSDD